LAQLTVGLTVAALGLASCDDGGLTDPQDVEFAPELGVNLAQMTRSPVGLYYQDEVVGTGALAQFGHRVTVEYTGWLPSGQQFDTSTTSGPFTFGPLGQAEVIAGWNMGVQGMRVGGHRLLVIPPTLAYGSAGRGIAIPGNSTLVFRVELTNVTQFIQ
jgi:FKBP-type peptidyl-prolyl cis-trans isomerase